MGAPNDTAPADDAQPAGVSRDHLWTFREYAKFLGVGERTAAEMETAGLLADPVILGPRLKRYFPDECVAALKRLPRERNTEPAHLAMARKTRLANGSYERVEQAKSASGSPSVDAEMLRTLKRATYLLSSARLVMTDDESRAIATEAVNAANAVIARAEGRS